MNPIKWSTISDPLDSLKGGTIQPKQFVNLQGGTVKADSSPLNRALQQKAINQFNLMRDDRTYDRQIARDNTKHMRDRAMADQKYGRQQSLLEEADRKAKEQKEEDWSRGGKLNHQIQELKFAQILAQSIDNVDKREQMNVYKSYLGRTIEEKQKAIESSRADIAKRWLRENVEDNDTISFADTPGDPDFEWDDIINNDFTLTGGVQFSEKDDSSQVKAKFDQLDGRQKLEFVRQVANSNSDLTFDEGIELAGEQELQAAVEAMRMEYNGLTESSPDSLELIRTRLKNLINPNLENNLMNDLRLSEAGSAPNFVPDIGVKGESNEPAGEMPPPAPSVNSADGVGDIVDETMGDVPVKLNQASAGIDPDAARIMAGPGAVKDLDKYKPQITDPSALNILRDGGTYKGKTLEQLIAEGAIKSQ